MKNILFATIFLSLNTLIRAQLTIEALAGNKYAHYISYTDKDLDSAAKWNYFNLNRFTVNYNNKALNTVSIEGQLTYQFKPWIGISTGGGFYGEFFIPTLGLSLSYANVREDFFIQLYPTIGFFEKQIGPSVLGIIGYVPKLSLNWGISSQIIFSVDPSEISQIARIGLDYKNKLQFGLGIDVIQRLNTSKLNTNAGLFLRFNV
jgi:hypothetical protein